MRGKVVIAGVGNTRYGKHPGRDRIDLIVEAARNAIFDAGISKDMLDGLFVKMANSEPSILYGQKVSEALGLRPTIGCSLDQGGAANIGLITYAAMAIEAGMIDTALVCYGDTARTGSRAVYHRPRGDDAVVGWYSTAAGYAMIHQAYRNRYQPRDEEFGIVAVQTREHGSENPDAHLRMPLTMDAYLSGPFVVEPLRRDDCCLVSDGGAAVILMSVERAKQLGRHAAVPILGLGQGQESWDVHLREDLLRTKAEDSARAAFKMAGIAPSDIGVAQIYDCFTVTVLQTLEDYGLAPRGQAGSKALAEGLGIDGWLPLNTSGGLLSESGTPGMQLIIEGVRQMRGDARLQVKNPGACIISNQGGSMHTHATLVLGEPL
ncbi:thiolase family protein [Phyllobacterium sp. YR531]|uniref:thiolase family protein n=1 Tax=Phyllobacterium sp. YR531 TaxID=1144343 RepID=UPI00026FB1D9|nr:thiolase family protein [Phyllobacterium sp. YR531]EJN06742.1 acetyl-CoA acetyltransferase [Phyllobacterium sp. YR531]